MTYYVTMTDKFMSGWGEAQGKINKLIFICDNYKQAEIVEQNAMARSEFKYINITTNKPHYSKQRYYAQVKTIDDYPRWYEANYFN